MWLRVKAPKVRSVPISVVRCATEADMVIVAPSMALTLNTTVGNKPVTQIGLASPSALPS